MNQKLWSGVAATLLISTLCFAPSTSANQNRSTGTDSEVKVSSTEESPSQEPEVSTANNSQARSATISTQTDRSEQRVATEGASTNLEETTTPSQPVPETSAPQSAQSGITQSEEVVKVGEYQSQEASNSEETVANIQSHEMNGRQAATLYVRNIPVLTFLGDSADAPAAEHPQASAHSAEVKVASIQNRSLENSPLPARSPSASGSTGDTKVAATATEDTSDPVWRATEAAAQLNQLYRESVDASTITVAWDDEEDCYVIKAGEDELIAMNSDIILPDTTRNPAQDALQATNRIRRQIGNAPPLSDVPGAPDAGNQVSLGPVQFTVSGLASWYGPGFDGNPSASGEIFNQNALTAAHRSLPFGTQVRVTNMDTGLSVVVRINDRGPYSHGRVIDLSTRAAQVIGLVQSGVAPVSLEVLGAAQTADRRRY